MPSKLAEKRNELTAKQSQLHAIFEEAGSDLDLSLVKSLEGDTHAKAAEIKRRNVELTALGEECDELALVERIAADHKAAPKQDAPAAPAIDGRPVVKGLGDLFVESATYKQRTGNRGPAVELPDVDLKVLMTTAAGWAPESIRTPGFVASAQVVPSIADIIPMYTTNQAAVVFMLESTFTNNAAARTEGANDAGESAFVLTPTTATVREFAVWVPVTREQMDDVSYVQAYLNNRLSLQLRIVIDAAIMTGAGAPSFAGLIGLAGSNTQAKGADPVLDAIYKGIVVTRVTGRAQPNAIIMHPLDMQDIRLTRTADGIYILGNPADSGQTRLWGLPVVENTACTQNTALVADFANYIQLVQKQGVQFEYTDSHAGLFIQRTLAVLATVRLALVCQRAAAVTQITGI